MSAATRARAHRSPIEHVLIPGTKETLCGKDATLMARYAPSDLPSGERTTPLHEACRALARAKREA